MIGCMRVTGLVRCPALGYMAGMAGAPTVLIADRSQLAANIYRLVLAPLGVNILIRQRCVDALAHLRTGAGVDLMIVNTNSLGPAQLDAVLGLFSDQRAARVKKIFIAGDSKAEERLCSQLEKLAMATFVARPFLPDDLLNVVRQRLARGDS